MDDAYRVICSSCGQANPDGFRFCGRCGAPLESPAPEVRKTVTVVFCDLVGSTALGERTDPELLRETMGRYHGELRTILERHGGTVEKFVGDAAMAVFGLPQVHEDDALRAVRAVLEMRAAVARLGLEVRIGVNTGEVVAGSGETLVTGDAVNVAARLEQAADAGEVLIGAATERLVREAVQAEPVEPLSLKGKSEPVSAFRLLGLTDQVPAFTRPIATPFVGRAPELEQLEAAVARAFDERSAQLATIVGPPGVGKSRLARELVGRTEARILVGRCLSYGEGITYWPLAEIAEQIGDVRAALAESDEAELAALRIGVGLGTADSTASPEEIAWGFRRLFEELARERPLVVVFDDIHWAEPPLLDLIEYIGTFSREVPLVLLCTARPDLFESRPDWTTPKPNATLLTLEPLEIGASTALVGQLGALPEETQRRIVEAAEGNPLFIEQLVAMHIESGGGELEVPPTLQALLAARIDRLAAEERAVVECGSVEGRLFHRGAVAELLPPGERQALGTQLLTLVRKELIRPDRGTVPGDDGFRFAHVLIRDAAYQAMPKRQRAALHEGYADWLAAKLGEAAPDEIVGYHLEQAYRYQAELGPAEEELAARAAERLAGAAAAARQRQDAAATDNLLTRAVELAPEGPLRRRLLCNLAETLVETGDVERARALLGEALAAARAAHDEHVEWLARTIQTAMRVTTEPAGEEHLAEVDTAIAAREPYGDHDVLARAWRVAADVHLLRSEALEQAKALEHAIAEARAAGDVALEAQLVIQSVPPLLFGPVPVEEALAYVDRVLESSSLPSLESFALHVRGHMWARRGEFDRALEAIEQWRRPLPELGQELAYATSAGCVWDVCSLAGDWTRAEAALRAAYETLERRGDRGFRSTLAAQLGECVLSQGLIDEAERWSLVSEELGVEEDRVNEAWWRSLRAKVHAARGELARAEELAREAVAIISATDHLEPAAAMWLTLAEVLQARGSSEACAAAREALERYERKGNLIAAERASALAGSEQDKAAAPTPARQPTQQTSAG